MKYFKLILIISLALVLHGCEEDIDPPIEEVEETEVTDCQRIKDSYEEVCLVTEKKLTHNLGDNVILKANISLTGDVDGEVMVNWTPSVVLFEDGDIYMVPVEGMMLPEPFLLDEQGLLETLTLLLEQFEVRDSYTEDRYFIRNELTVYIEDVEYTFEPEWEFIINR